MYEMTKEVKIVRRKHKVTFRAGTTVDHLISLLKNVPSGATVDEVLECTENDNSSIEFHEETRAE